MFTGIVEEVGHDVNVQKVQLAYQLDINEFRDKQNLQLIVRHMLAC